MTEGNPANVGRKQDGRFARGRSGNPSGKKPGTRHKATQLVEQLMQADVEEVCEAVVRKAKDGDMTAARIIVDRILPPRRDRPITFDLPPIENASDASRALGAILGAVGKGELSPGEAGDIAKLVDSFTKALELGELDQRVRALEEKNR